MFELSIRKEKKRSTDLEKKTKEEIMVKSCKTENYELKVPYHMKITENEKKGSYCITVETYIMYLVKYYVTN